MGLLDDAIREHLELKRRRGADPDEIARQEDEALGDPRSGEFAREDADDQAPEPSAIEDEPEPDDDAWFDDDEERAADEREDVAEPEREPDVVRPADQSAADQDVLGETPEFLQETPEHDRLWFEQKPPRDFDFDG